MTIEAWIKPEGGDEFARLQTIAMLGDLGWGVQLMCPEGAGLGCCGDHVLRSVGFFAQGTPSSDACESTMSSTVGVALDEWSHIAVVVDPEGYTRPIPPPPPPSPPPPPTPPSPPCMRQIVVTRTDGGNDFWGMNLTFNCASEDGTRNMSVNVGPSANPIKHVYHDFYDVLPSECPTVVDKANCAPHCDSFTPQDPSAPMYDDSFAVSVGECVPPSGCRREVHITRIHEEGDIYRTSGRPGAWGVDLDFTCGHCTDNGCVGNETVYVGNSGTNPLVVETADIISDPSSCPFILDGQPGRGDYPFSDLFVVDVRDCVDPSSGRRRALLEAPTPVSPAATARRASLPTSGRGATRPRSPRRRLSQSSCDPSQGACGCNATAPMNGTLGNCTQQLNHSDTCVPECVADYALVGTSSCDNGAFHSATCVYDGEYKTADVFCPAWQNMLTCSIAGDDEAMCTGGMFNETCVWRDEDQECVSKVAADVATFNEAIQKSHYVLSQNSQCLEHPNNTVCESDNDCYWYEDDNECGHSQQFAEVTLTADMSTLNRVTLAFERLQRLDQLCSGHNETECPKYDECQSATRIEQSRDGLSHDVFDGCEPSETYYLSEAKDVCAGQGATFTSTEETIAKRAPPSTPDAEMCPALNRTLGCPLIQDETACVAASCDWNDVTNCTSSSAARRVAQMEAVASDVAGFGTRYKVATAISNIQNRNETCPHSRRAELRSPRCEWKTAPVLRRSMAVYLHRRQRVSRRERRFHATTEGLLGKTMVEIYTETDIFPRIFAPYCDLTTNGIITRAPEHGSRGDCNFRLAAGEECQPECDANYRVARNTSCSIDAQLTEGLCEPTVFFHTTVTIYINHVKGIFRSDIDPLPSGNLVHVNLTSGSGSDPRSCISAASEPRATACRTKV